VHWINAVAMILMIMSGWQIYNASPLFDFRFRQHYARRLARRALLWHFAAMWLLMVNGLVYLITGLATGRFRRSCCRSRRVAWCLTFKAALTFSSPMTISANTFRAEAALCRIIVVAS